LNESGHLAVAPLTDLPKPAPYATARNHNETACNYNKGGQTHASMTMATSDDYGHTWKIE
jgi:hypothetical protein